MASPQIFEDLSSVFSILLQKKSEHTFLYYPLFQDYLNLLTLIARQQILPSEMVFRKDLRLLKIPAKTLHLAEAGEMIQEKRIQEEQDAGQIREMEQKRLLNSKVQRYGFLER